MQSIGQKIQIRILTTHHLYFKFLKTSCIVTCVLRIVVMFQVGSHMSMGAPVPDSDDGGSWADSVKDAFNKAKDSVKSSFDSASGKISEIGENIKNSETYGKVSDELQNVGEKISKAGDGIKESDAFQNVKNTFNKGVDSIKDKFDD